MAISISKRLMSAENINYHEGLPRTFAYQDIYIVTDIIPHQEIAANISAYQGINTDIIA